MCNDITANGVYSSVNFVNENVFVTAFVTGIFQLTKTRRKV